MTTGNWLYVIYSIVATHTRQPGIGHIMMDFPGAIGFIQFKMCKHLYSLPAIIVGFHWIIRKRIPLIIAISRDEVAVFRSFRSYVSDKLNLCDIHSYLIYPFAIDFSTRYCLTYIVNAVSTALVVLFVVLRILVII